MKSFEQMNLSPRMVEALKQRGIKELTPVQEAAIPVCRAGRDVIVQAQTGTGKTLAFLVPIFELAKAQAKVAQALVIAPTRELAIQIAKVAQILGEAEGISSLVLYGGQDIERQKQKLRRCPQVIIGTPGRLLDHLRRGTIDVSKANKVVLDEGDEMLRLGFIEDVEILLGKVAPDHQLMLFSATMPARVRALSAQYMERPKMIEIRAEHVTLDTIEQVVVSITEDEKLDRLSRIINEEQPYLMMVFCHTKQRAHQVAMALAARGYLADELHGDLTQAQRALVLRRFREAKLQVLCATDIAARGLDIEGVTHVVSYDVPHDAEAYVHRIGRTGRAGGEGKAVTFVTARQYEKLRRIEAGIKARIRRENAARREKRAAEKREMGKPEKKDNRAKKPRSKHASRKGAVHKGQGGGRRRAGAKAARPAKRKSSLGRRAKLGKHR